MDRAPPSLADAVAAAQEWWLAAGVEIACADEVQTWLAPESDPTDEAASRAPAPLFTAPPPPPPPRVGGDIASWPQELAGFAPWWLEEPTLDTGGLGPRVAPRGPANAPLMVLVPMPEIGDSEELLSGGEGRLIANIAAAMGIAGESIYWASALPRHAAAPDWAALAANGLGEMLRHHIALAQPGRVLVFGNSVLSLLQNAPAQDPPTEDKSGILTGRVPMLGGHAPDKLLANARARAMLWRRLLDWTES